MEHDDPEKRIDVPEHQPAEPKRGSRKPARIGAWIAVVLGGLCVFGGLAVGIELGVLHAVAYRFGTPTTVTIDHCASETSLRGNHERCYGRWGAGGKSNMVPIIGDYHRDGVGSQVDVRLVRNRNGTPAAFTASEGRPNYLWTAGGVLAIAGGSALMWSARRKIKTGSWPWSGRGSKPPGPTVAPDRR